MSACSASRKTNNMSEVREEVWSPKMVEANVRTAPYAELKALPPTTESVEENVQRTCIKTAIWKSALHSSPLPLDATE